MSINNRDVNGVPTMIERQTSVCERENVVSDELRQSVFFQLCFEEACSVMHTRIF